MGFCRPERLSLVALGVVVMANHFVDDESEKLLTEGRIEAGRICKGPKPRDLNALSVGVGWGEPHLGLVLADAFGDLETFGEEMNQCSVDVVDAVTAFSKYLVVIHPSERIALVNQRRRVADARSGARYAVLDERR